MSGLLAAMADEELAGLELSGGVRSLWSTTGTAQIGGQPVFVKRVPLGAAEMADPYSTRNHYGLPSFYQYGVGSAGFGAFRELGGLEKASKWVLEATTAAFPLLYHHRILPGRPGPWRDRWSLADYVAYWGGSPAVGDCIQARIDAEHELWIFLEAFPETVSGWLMDNQHLVGSVTDQLSEAVGVLRRGGATHFDAHLGNVITDGEGVRLADFGLVSDAAFELSQEEADFLGRHRFYDLGLVFSGLGLECAFRVRALSEEQKAEVDRRCGIGGSSTRTEIIIALVDGAEEIANVAGLSPEYVAHLRRFREVNRYMHDFIGGMQARNEKDVAYSDDELRGLLLDAGLELA